MKGCLKHSSSTGPVGCTHKRKCVAFCASGLEEVHVADEWDRTPTEPARNLSYEDVLELKEIQRSLPRANQLPDILSHRPASQYLSAVPIGLLPLLPETASASTPAPEDKDKTDNSYLMSTQSPPSTDRPVSATSGLLFPNGIPSCQPPKPQPIPLPLPSTTRTLSHLSHLPHLFPSKVQAPRPKPKFAFLPLLDTPPSSTASSAASSSSSSPYPSEPSSPDSRILEIPHEEMPLHEHETEHDPPTPSLTNASLDSSPLSRASSLSPDHELPPYHHFTDAEVSHPEPAELGSYFPPFSDHPASVNVAYESELMVSSTYAMPSTLKAVKLSALPSPALLPPSPLCLSTSPYPTPGHGPQGTGSPTLLAEAQPIRRRKRNFILINDEEVEIPGDDSEEEEDTDVLPSLSGLSLSHPTQVAVPSTVLPPSLLSPSPSIPTLPSPQLTPTPSPPPEPTSHPGSHTQMPSPPTPTLASSSISNRPSYVLPQAVIDAGGQQATPPPSEPGSPNLTPLREPNPLSPSPHRVYKNPRRDGEGDRESNQLRGDQASSGLSASASSGASLGGPSSPPSCSSGRVTTSPVLVPSAQVH